MNMQDWNIPSSVNDEGQPLQRYLNIIEDDILIFAAKKGQNKFHLKYGPIIKSNINGNTVIQVGKDIDSADIKINITSHKEKEIVTKDKINIRGFVTAFKSVCEMTANDDRVSISSTGLFSYDAQLKDGENIISFKAFDKYNIPVIQNIRLFYNVINITQNDLDDSININITSPPNYTIIYEQFVDIKVELDDTSIQTINITDGTGTINKTGKINEIFSAKVLLIGGYNLIKVDCINNKGIKSESILTVIKQGTSSEIDTDSPIITIQSHKNGQVVNISPINFFGTIDDPEVTTISINSEDVPIKDGKWYHNIGMQIGNNDIEVEAVDHAGNISIETISIKYQP